MIHSCLFVVQSLSHAQLFATAWTAARQASLSFTISQSLLKFMSIESVMPPTISSFVSSPPALNLSQHQGLFQWVGSSHQVAKALELQLQHHSSDGYSWSILPPNIYQAFAMCQCCVHCSTWRLCFHPHSNPVRLGLSISPLHRWENRGSHRLGDLTKTVSSKARIEVQVIWVLCYFPSSAYISFHLFFTGLRPLCFSNMGL